MDYTLIVVYTDPHKLPVSFGCATSTDVWNNMASIMRTEFSPEIDSGAVNFHVIDNTAR